MRSFSPGFPLSSWPASLYIQPPPRAPFPSLRHLEAAAGEHLRNPAGVGESATGKSLYLLVDVVLHAPDGRGGLIQQEVCCATIAVVRKTNAAGVGEDHSCNAPIERGGNLALK